ncbi:ABC transporter permease [Helicobacter sp. 13S00477-4]|uniref:ABC transporter permease n=1 Tax=Helicobacter sp. 13S00477-4 TaxID=1905759 RepID=UPI000BA5CC01|nr:ABC transporter permease [Helicobacter sp. 13S00477-4]PAF50329.1 hypothetical protein BKH44_08420 [Helicobacter sp. 13S00477-4]
MDIFKKQILSIMQNKFLLLIYFVLPLMLGLIVYSIFYMGLPRELPIGLIDEDKSALSTQIKFDLNATSTLKVVQVYDSIYAAKNDLSIGKIYGLVVLPKDMERRVKIGMQTKILFYYNAQFVLIGKAINSAFLKVVGTINAKANFLKSLIKDSNFDVAMSVALPISSEIHALYNSNNSYSEFLLTLILPCMWQILIALGMVNLLQKSLDTKALLIAYSLNVSIFSCWGMVMLKFFEFLGYSMKGEGSILFLGVLVMVAGISGVVIFVQSLLGDIAKTVGVVAAYTAPSLAFAGITYPQGSMEGFALFWSHLLPISYFMKFYLQQADYGLDIVSGLKIIGQMLPFLLFFPLGIFIHNLRQK